MIDKSFKNHFKVKRKLIWTKYNQTYKFIEFIFYINYIFTIISKNQKQKKAFNLLFIIFSI